MPGRAGIGFWYGDKLTASQVRDYSAHRPFRQVRFLCRFGKKLPAALRSAWMGFRSGKNHRANALC
jgi:hypothetical protein